MKLLFQWFWLVFLVPYFFGCTSKKSSLIDESWEGYFYLTQKGKQKATLDLSYADSVGIAQFPDLIPIPLDIVGLLKNQDSVKFTINFRSGPAFCKSKLMGDSLSGIMLALGRSERFVLTRSKNSLYNRPKPKVEDRIVIRTKSGTDDEIRTQQILDSLLNVHDLEKFLYTKEVLIEENTIPHSHPVLTLKTGEPNADVLLSTFLHEQMHWFLMSNRAKTEAIVKELEVRYPEAQINPPQGSGDRQSTIEHILVGYFEYTSLQEVAGENRTREVFDYLRSHHYTWVYNTLLRDRDEIEEVVDKAGLRL